MSLISLLIVVIVCGLIVYAIDLIPIAAPFNRIAKLIVILIVILALLEAIGVLPNLNAPLRLTR